jgi:hypothetical protein
MRYWDEDHPEWNAAERDFAAAWRSQPKWVVFRSLRPVGPNATLINGDVEEVVRGLKAASDRADRSFGLHYNAQQTCKNAKSAKNLRWANEGTLEFWLPLAWHPWHCWHS